MHEVWMCPVVTSVLVHASLLCRLFSRVEPAHKSLIVEYLQEDGNVCAMVRMQREGEGEECWEGWWGVWESMAV